MWYDFLSMETNDVVERITSTVVVFVQEDTAAPLSLVLIPGKAVYKRGSGSFKEFMGDRQMPDEAIIVSVLDMEEVDDVIELMSSEAGWCGPMIGPVMMSATVDQWESAFSSENNN
jgi:hypothetical protein